TNPLLSHLKLPNTLINSNIKEITFTQENKNDNFSRNITINTFNSSNENLAFKIDKLNLNQIAQNFIPKSLSLSNTSFSLQSNNPLIQFINNKNHLNIDKYFNNIEMNSLDSELILDHNNNQKSKIIFSSFSVDNYPQIRNFNFIGSFKNNYTSIDQLSANTFDGDLLLNGIVKYDNNIAYDLNLKAKAIDLQQILLLYKERNFNLTGKINADILTSSSNIKPQIIQASVSSNSDISIEQEAIEQILKQLKLSNQKNLTFKSAQIDLNLINNLVSIKKAELLNNQFISIIANNSKIFLDNELKPQTFEAPLSIQAPYSLIKWRDYLMTDGKTVEIPLALNGHVDNIKSIVITAIAQAVLNNTIKNKLFKSDKNNSDESSNQTTPSKDEKIKDTIKDVLNLFGK
ncbi:MAG: intermembrane phospholipid transport protein YdbH family protein, partial [Lentisphaeria bacterium]